jgi:hypothetical protein
MDMFNDLLTKYPDFTVVFKRDKTVATTWVDTEDGDRLLRFTNTVPDVPFERFIEVFHKGVDDFLNKRLGDTEGDGMIDLDISER